MAARSPRRSFATPFVIVTLAACHHEAKEPVHYNPARPMDPSSGSDAPASAGSGSATSAAAPVTPPTEAEPAPRIIANPPPPDLDADADVPTGNQRWTLSRHGDKCEAMAAVNCGPPPKKGEPMHTCNPPPPQPYKCNSHLQEDGDTLQIERRKGDTACFTVIPHHVDKPGEHWNPAPPQSVVCPK